MKTFRCKACRQIQPANPRSPNQQYCGQASCQRARKREWQRKKRATDPDYRQNQIDAHKQWQKEHPEYWRAYRKKKKRLPSPPNPSDVKMDRLSTNLPIVPGRYILIPAHGQNIKMDAFQAIIFPIPASYDQAKDDTIGKIATFAYDCLKNNGLVRTSPHCST